MAAVNGHHVPGTAYHWFHEWKPRDVATALVYGKRRPHTVGSRELRQVKQHSLEHNLDRALHRENFPAFDRLAAESDRRDQARAAARDARTAKTAAARDAQTKHYETLLNSGHDHESAVEKAFGVPVEKQRDQAALAQLRGAGYSGAGLKEAARKGFADETRARYRAAEDATNGHMLNKAGQAAGVDPKSLFAGPAARVNKYGSDELKSWFDQHGRPTFDEYLHEVRGHVQAAGRVRAGRGDFLASREHGEALQLSAKTAGYTVTPSPRGPNDLWWKPGFKLPNYIENVARGLQRSGHSESQAIQMAIGVCRRWAAGGGNVHPEVRAAAAAAIAEWEALKAKAKSVKSTRHFKGSAVAARVDLAAAPPGPAARRRMAKDGTALPDGSYPIPDKTALGKAIQAFGRAPEEKRPKVVAHIRKHARRLGAMGDPKVQNFLSNH